MFVEKNYWDVLDKAGLMGDNLCPGKNDYKSGGIFYSLFLALRIKYCLSINEFGIIEERKSFIKFNYSKRLLDCSHFLKRWKVQKYQPCYSKSKKKSFNSGFIIPTKMRFCNQ